MKKIYIVGVLLLAILVGVVIGQNQEFVLAKDEGYVDREGYQFERCRASIGKKRYLEDNNQQRHNRRGHMHHRGNLNYNDKEFDREFFNNHMEENHRFRMYNPGCIR